MLSAVVLTKNEEKNIKECLESLDFCDEILVIDDNSTDKTATVAQNLGAGVIKRSLNGDFAAQRNFALTKVKGSRVLFIDADERLLPALKKEIQLTINNQQSTINGFYFRRKDKFLGVLLNHGETANIKLLRLAKKDAGKWVGKVHEVWQVKGKTSEFKNPLIHERDLTIAQFLRRINHYTSIRSAELFQQRATTNMFWVTVYPLIKFFQNYCLRLGFLDGVPGFIFAVLMSLHSFMVRAKLWVRQQNKGEEEFKITNWQAYE